MSWQLGSTALLAAVLACGFAWYEQRRPPARIVALVAVMAALAVVGRLAFAAIPNVKPTTDIVLFAGFALGAVPGFAVGAITALASNVFLGQGPWTVWQMAAWGGVGAGGALLARAHRGHPPGRLSLALACGVAGLAFGAVMDVYQWTLAARQDLPTYVAVSGTSLPYNLAHAIGNVAFSLAIGPVFIRSLLRWRRRFEVRWAAPVAAAGALGLALAAGAGALRPEPASAAASPAGKALRYLERAQNRDGGFGAARGQASSQLMTGWAALGLASARRNPRDVARRGGRAVTSYLSRGARGLRDTGELERTIMVLAASGLRPRAFAGRDLVTELTRRRRADGSWAGNVAFTSFAVFALRAAGVSRDAAAVRRAAAWLERAQNGDGGFGYVPAAASDADDTGAALQALAAAGRRRVPAARRGISYLRSVQGRDGGWGQANGRASNSQSTAWAVQGLVALGVRPATGARDPIRFLTRLQRRDGHVAYSRSSDQTPVWVTAQALIALRRKPFPLARVPRRASARAGAAPGASRAGSAAATPSSRRRAPRKPVRQATQVAAGPREKQGVAPQQAAPALRAAASERRRGDRGGQPSAGWAVAAALALAAAWRVRRRLRPPRRA